MLNSPIIDTNHSIITKNLMKIIELALDRKFLLTFKELKRYQIGGVLGNITENNILDYLPNYEQINGFIVPINLKYKRKLIQKSLKRRKLHLSTYKKAVGIASEFIQELIQYCPFVKSVLLSGSLATGGFRSEDDIDFNIFCETGTKYLTWLTAILLGIKFSIKYRKRQATLTSKTGLPLEKLICVNVVWWEGQCLPFSRQDLGLGFELMLSKVIYNPLNHFDKILTYNRKWLQPLFPQLFKQNSTGIPQKELNLIGKIFKFISSTYLLKRFFEIWSRGFSWLIFNFVQWRRRNNPIAKAHIQHIAQVKFPYEVFQENTI